jgi:predicted transcriptional regulator
VTESNGNVLWRLEDVYFLPAIDEGGSLYVFRDDVTGLPVEAYSPDGMLRWSLNMSERIGGGQGDQPQWNPIYSNGTLYVWLKCGVIALNPNGTVKWTKDFGGQGWHVAGGYRPDESGYLYISNSYGESYVLIIGPDGSEIKVPDNGAHLSSADRIVDGIAYVTTNNAHEGVPSSDDSRLEPPGIYDTMSGKQYFNLDMPSIDDFEQETVTAYDVRSGQQLWSFSLPSNRTCSVILNQSNVRYLMPGFADFATEVNKLPPDTWYNNAGLPTGSIKIKGTSSMTLYPGKDVRYVDYWAYNYEYPPFFGKSNCTSTGGLFALDRTGRLLWSTPTDSYITGVSEKNGTVYFATGDGRFSAASAGIGAGALAAAAYLFLRFFAMGTVTRARARLQKNGNRNGILGLIVAQPGPTLHEISRGTGLNVGTVRYHLFILATNHKIITYTDGTKFIRYFPGSGRYTDDEKLIIGLIRREPVKKMLMAMNEKQWQTNVEIADQSDLQESAVSKLLRELYGLGVIRKTVAVGEKTTYSLVEKFKPIVRDELGNANASPHYSPDISDGKITVN